MKQKPAAINAIWLWLIVIAILVGMANGSMEAVTNASFDAAKSAVNLAIKLIGVMAFWLGLMKVAEAGGLMRMIARAIRPLMVRLFPEVPPEHPAMAAMIMNIAANMLGLGNAATPLGIKGMIELNKLNPKAGEATNAMCLFLAINTSSVTILPLGVIGVRAAAGASDPASIIVPGIVATVTSTLVGIIAAKLLARKSPATASTQVSSDNSEQDQLDTVIEDTNTEPLIPPGKLGKYIMGLGIGSALAIVLFRVSEAIQQGELVSFKDEVLQYWVIPLIMLAILVFGYLRGVKVYEVATEGAKEGLQVALRIIPFLVMILVAIGMFKASGAFAFFADLAAPLTQALGIPADVLPMALMRPLSGSGAFGVMSEIVANAPDSFSSYLASIMQGSTETTFYVLAVYFGAVGITRPRHAVAAALLADAAGLTMAVIMAHLTFGG